MILMSLVAALNVNAASWTKEDSANKENLKSQALHKVLKAFNKSAEKLEGSFQPDTYATTARIKSKKASEPLANSIMQLYYIGASDWYCDVEVQADTGLTRKITRDTVNDAVNTFTDVLNHHDIDYNEYGVEMMSDSFYSILKKNKLSFMGANIYCNDEYAFYSIFSVFDDETNEVLNLSLGYSD
jgi:hypothetical protein